MVVFKERGIFEVVYTADVSMPFIIQKTSENIGAFHGTLKAEDNYIIFAHYGGVYAYRIGGGITRISDAVSETYNIEVINSGKSGNLRSLYNPDLGQYWLACGSGVANDKILVFDKGYGAWTVFGSAITGFDVQYMANSNDAGVIIPWFGAADSIYGYGEHYTEAVKLRDEESDGTALNVESYFATHYLGANSPSVLKRMVETIIWGTGKSSGSVTVAALIDGGLEVGLGVLDFYDATWQPMNRRVRYPPMAARCHYAKLKFSENGGAASDTRWGVNSLGVKMLLLGMR